MKSKIIVTLCTALAASGAAALITKDELITVAYISASVILLSLVSFGGVLTQKQNKEVEDNWEEENELLLSKISRLEANNIELRKKNILLKNQIETSRQPQSRGEGEDVVVRYITHK